MPEPDVMAVQGQRSDFDAWHPTYAVLAVEVAVSSMKLDREKVSLYAEANVAEYWIVLVSEQQIEVYRRPESGVYQQKRVCLADKILRCASIPGFQVALAELFA